MRSRVAAQRTETLAEAICREPFPNNAAPDQRKLLKERNLILPQFRTEAIRGTPSSRRFPSPATAENAFRETIR